MEFLLMDWLGTPVWFWLSFIGLVATLTAFDLGFLHKEDKEMGIGESLKLTAFYIAIALAFGVWVWMQKGADLGMKYYTGFFIEKALSIDNVFVISLIFTFFAIPAKYQYRALLWGILAVIVLRGAMIAAGAALVEQAYWVLYIFAAFLVFTGIKMFFAGDHAPDIAKNPVVRWISSPPGFHFDGLPPKALPEAWLSPSTEVSAPKGTTTLTLGPEPLIGKQALILTSADAPGRRIVVSTDGLRPFVVSTGNP